jgi:hypothetical protein
MFNFSAEQPSSFGKKISAPVNPKKINITPGKPGAMGMICVGFRSNTDEMTLKFTSFA